MIAKTVHISVTTFTNVQWNHLKHFTLLYFCDVKHYRRLFGTRLLQVFPLKHHHGSKRSHCCNYCQLYTLLPCTTFVECYFLWSVKRLTKLTNCVVLPLNSCPVWVSIATNWNTFVFNSSSTFIYGGLQPFSTHVKPVLTPFYLCVVSFAFKKAFHEPFSLLSTWLSAVEKKVSRVFFEFGGMNHSK